MQPNLDKLQFLSTKQSYKNNNTYRGSFSISGSTVSGYNQKTTTITLPTTPDLVDIMFNGPSDSAFIGASDPRTDSGWFRVGGTGWGRTIYVRGDNAGAGYTNYPTFWNFATSLTGTTITVTMIWVQQFTAPLTLTSTSVNYRIIDYSVY